MAGELEQQMEFLLEMGDGSKKELSAQRKNVVEAIAKHIQSHFGHDQEVFLCGLSAEIKEGAASYALQRWSTKWSEYVDVTSCEDIKSGDKFKFVSKSSPKGVIAGAISVCSGLVKPKEEHAKYLSTLFPGSSSSSQPSTSTATFNPTKNYSGRKKGSRMRPFKLWVVVGKELFSSVPKGSARRALNKNGRVKRVEFRRSLSERQVQNRIMEAFPHLQMNKPTFMKCVDLKMVRVEVDGSGYPTGSAVQGIASKESLYLVESSSVMPMESRSRSVSPDTDNLMEQADQVVAKLKAPIELSSDSGEDDAYASGHMESLEEWRRIRMEQDSAYEESLAIDRKKALLRELRQELEEKDFRNTDDVGGISVSIRFSNYRVDHMFQSTASVRDLYQLVVAKGKMEDPFTIFRVMPREPIPLSDTALANLNIGGNLLTHEADNSTDFFEFFLNLRDNTGHMGDDTAGWSAVISKAEMSRKMFVADTFKGKLSLSAGSITVSRRTIFSDTIVLYSTKPRLLNQFPIEVHFNGEDGVDFGGVSRDFFSAFWEEAYTKMFDGVSLVTPVCRADIDMNHFSVLGKILSHGYLCCGFLPTRICFPVLALVSLGLSITIRRKLFVKFFLESLSHVDQVTMTVALEAKEFTQTMKTNIICILSRFGCRDIPTPQNLEHLLYSQAQHQFKTQPYAALSLMHEGIPEKHRPFWGAMKVDELCRIYEALTASPEKVLEQVQEPTFASPDEERVFGYLQQYVGGMKVDEVKRFVRFVTGSSVLTGSNISITFNAVTGLARRPFAHTCSSQLELSYNYGTYLEFASEFAALLGNEDSWSMNSL